MNTHRKTPTPASPICCVRCDCDWEPASRTPAAFAALDVHRRVHAEWPAARRRIILFEPMGAR